MKILKAKQTDKHEMNFSLIKDDVGEINLMVSKDNGRDTTLVLYIAKDGYVRLRSGLKQKLERSKFDIKNLQFDNEGRIEIHTNTITI